MPQILEQEEQNRKVFDAHCRRPLRAALGIRLASEQIRPWTPGSGLRVWTVTEGSFPSHDRVDSTFTSHHTPQVLVHRSGTGAHAPARTSSLHQAWGRQRHGYWPWGPRLPGNEAAPSHEHSTRWSPWHSMSTYWCQPPGTAHMLDQAKIRPSMASNKMPNATGSGASIRILSLGNPRDGPC